MIAWPNGARGAAAFTFDFDAEEVWIGDDPKNTDRPGVLSQGTYGAKVAIPLILAMLERRGLCQTFFVPGRVAERYPERVRQIFAAGHEIGHHGYTHTSPARLDPAAEEIELQRALDVLSDHGVKPSGYRSPSWELSPATIGLLGAHGFAYSSNYMDDVHPYLHAESSVVELPVQWLLDDAPHFWFSSADWTRRISPVEDVEAIWAAELDAIVELGGCCVITLHPQIIGRPHRLRFLERFIGQVQNRSDVWVATCREIAEHARLELASARS